MRVNQVHVFNRFVVAFSLLACFVVAACAQAGVSPTQPTPTMRVPAYAARLQPLLLAKMQQLRIPGAIVYVNEPGQGSWTTALGTSDLATHAPMNVNSHMRIASITKTMTSTVILQLVDQHKLGLDDPVSKYQPEVPNGAHITIRELLNMTSGLFNFDEDPGFMQTWQADPGKVWNPQEELAIAYKHPPYFAPGKGDHYSNTNYILLGLIIEQLTRQPVEEVFQQRIFTPLGMNGSSLPPATSAAIPDPHPQGYMYGSLLDLLEGPKANAVAGTPHDVTSWSLSQAWTAGAAISTVHDLQIWPKRWPPGNCSARQCSTSDCKWSHKALPSSGTGWGLSISWDFLVTPAIFRDSKALWATGRRMGQPSSCLSISIQHQTALRRQTPLLESSTRRSLPETVHRTACR